jgi:hypothetical protein
MSVQVQQRLDAWPVQKRWKTLDPEKELPPKPLIYMVF